jgi:P27 family predicted phage terminase small subunit
MNLPPSAPKMPSGMCSQAKREWKRIVPLLLDLGTLTQVDGVALHMYCEAYATYIEVTKLIRAEGLTYTSDGEGTTKMKRPHPALTIQNESERKMRSFMECFGMSAGSRSRIKVDRPANTDNPVEKFMEGK